MEELAKIPATIRTQFALNFVKSADSGILPDKLI